MHSSRSYKFCCLLWYAFIDTGLYQTAEVSCLIQHVGLNRFHLKVGTIDGMGNARGLTESSASTQSPQPTQVLLILNRTRPRVLVHNRQGS